MVNPIGVVARSLTAVASATIARIGIACLLVVAACPLQATEGIVPMGNYFALQHALNRAAGGTAPADESPALPTPPPVAAVDVVVVDGRSYQVVDGIYYDDDGAAWRPLVVTTTAYTPTTEECDEDPETTATGTRAFETYGVAADPRALPYGTVLRIGGYGDSVVDDTGADMRRAWNRGVVHLDLRIPFRRYDGRWRSASLCKAIALEHGMQRHRTVLVGVGSNARRSLH